MALDISFLKDNPMYHLKNAADLHLINLAFNSKYYINQAVSIRTKTNMKESSEKKYSLSPAYSWTFYQNFVLLTVSEHMYVWLQMLFKLAVQTSMVYVNCSRFYFSP